MPNCPQFTAGVSRAVQSQEGEFQAPALEAEVAYENYESKETNVNEVISTHPQFDNISPPYSQAVTIFRACQAPHAPGGCNPLSWSVRSCWPSPRPRR